jgi:hypothetical protein
MEVIAVDQMSMQTFAINVYAINMKIVNLH